MAPLKKATPPCGDVALILPSYGVNRRRNLLYSTPIFLKQEVIRVVHVLHVPQDVTLVGLDVARVGLIEVRIRNNRIKRAVERQPYVNG